MLLLITFIFSMLLGTKNYCGMLQLGSRQGTWDVHLGFGEQSCKLGESPILACTTTLLGTKHYCGMLQLGSRQGMRMSN